MEKWLFIIGAPKAGTTSLASWLNGHDNFYLPERKEVGFFRSGPREFVGDTRGKKAVLDIDRNIDSYYALYHDSKEHQWHIDASTDYLSDHGACKSIRKFKDANSGRLVKVVCVLRDPVDRAFSEYRHTRRDTLETESFRRSLELEGERTDLGYQPIFFHARRSRYYEDICRYRSAFGHDFQILDFAKIKNLSYIREVFSQLCHVKFDGGVELDQLNQSKAFLNPSVRKIISNPTLRRVARVVSTEGVRTSVRETIEETFKDEPKISKDDREFLLSLLHDDIQACYADPDIPTESWRTSE